MTLTAEMMRSYPADMTIDRVLLAHAVDMLIETSEACTSCADSCLSEDAIEELRKCIRTNMDCADICGTTARVLSRHTGYDANISMMMLEACVQACRACADECEAHSGMHDHCRMCAESCRKTERACLDVLEAMEHTSSMR